MANRLTEFLDALSPTLPQPREPRNGEIVFAMMMWRARRGSTWRPSNADAIPPFTEGRYTILWFVDRELPPVLRQVLDANAESLKNATKNGRVKSWSVPVRVIFNHDETAQIVATPSMIGGGL